MNEDELKELELMKAFLKSKGLKEGNSENSEESEEYSPEEHELMKAFLAQKAKEPKPTSSPSYGKMALDAGKEVGLTALKALAYPGGLVRTAAAKAGEFGYNSIAEHQKTIVTDEDFSNALKGEATPSSEFLGRLGIKKGMVRSGLGFISDVALDVPAMGAINKLGKAGATALSGAPKVANAITKATELYTNPLGPLFKKQGTAVYQSAPVMKAADAALERVGKGKNAFSESLLRRGDGFRGSASKLNDFVQGEVKSLGNAREALLSRADNLSELASAPPFVRAVSELNMERAMGPAKALIDKWKKSGDHNLENAIKYGEEQIAKFIEKDVRPDTIKKIPIVVDHFGVPVTTGHFDQLVPGIKRGVTPSKAHGYATTIYNQAPASTWDTLSKTKEGMRINKFITYGLKREARAVADAVEPGLGRTLKSLDTYWGKLLSARGAVWREARKEINKNNFTSVDGMLLGTSMATGKVGLGATVLKKVADAAKTNNVRTTVGKGLYNTGKSGLGSSLVKTGVYDALYKKPKKE